MKKHFLFVMMAVIAFAFCACDQNTPSNPSGDNGGGNSGGSGGSSDTTSYPYLTLSDITPLQSLSLSDAEAKLTQMGFVGGYMEKDKSYRYAKGKDTLFLGVDSLQKVLGVAYVASKGVAPSKAKGWLKHVPEKVPMPQGMAQITGHTEMLFNQAKNEGINPWQVSTYSDYLAKIDNITSGVTISASWQSPDADGKQPYGLVLMNYVYVNGVDQAYLGIGIPREHKAEPVEPIDPVEYVFIKHPWGTGYAEDWSWKMMEYDVANDYYYLYDYWGGVGAYVNSVPEDEGATWIDVASISGHSWGLTGGEYVMFKYEPKVTDYAKLTVWVVE